MTTDSLITYFNLHETALRLKVSLQVAQWWSDSGILESIKDKHGSTLISGNSIDGLLREEQLVEQKASQMPTDEPSLKMLIVEDDEAMVKLYKRQIQNWKLPISIFTAINGRDALLAIGRESPDLVVTDLNMNDMDGFQMLCSFTPSPNSNGIEIIAVTGLDQYEITERGGLPPSVKVLYKPIKFTALREMVEQILSMQDVY